MKIFVIGGGGREHALVWKLRQSPQVKQIWCAPGNGGISVDAECVPANPGDVQSLVELAERLRPDLTVVGPEQPLVLGVVDAFARRGLAIVGPSQKGAQLEGSKILAKEFMERHGIPTAAPYGMYDSPGDAYAALCAVDWPMVVKADGLCAGKGVLVTSSPDEATAFIERLMEKREFGEGGSRVLIEEGLEGQELSYIVLTDGGTVVPLVPTRDHKRAFDGNRGPNTGGMGAYSSDSLVSAELETTIRERIVNPTIQGLAKEGRSYRGFLYFGLMLTAEGPKVLEYNCRLGDPETQAIVLRMDFNLAEALMGTAQGDLSRVKVGWKAGASLCVVLASGGYPGEFQSGKPITGLKEATDVRGSVIFHAGTKRDGANYYTSGGRVLGVTAFGSHLDSAHNLAYEAARRIKFEGCHFRADVGRNGAPKEKAVGDGKRA